MHQFTEQSTGVVLNRLCRRGLGGHDDRGGGAEILARRRRGRRGRVAAYLAAVDDTEPVIRILSAVVRLYAIPACCNGTGGTGQSGRGPEHSLVGRGTINADRVLGRARMAVYNWVVDLRRHVCGPTYGVGKMRGDFSAKGFCDTKSGEETAGRARAKRMKKRDFGHSSEKGHQFSKP